MPSPALPTASAITGLKLGKSGYLCDALEGRGPAQVLRHTVGRPRQGTARAHVSTWYGGVTLCATDSGKGKLERALLTLAPDEAMRLAKLLVMQAASAAACADGMPADVAMQEAERAFLRAFSSASEGSSA